MGLAAWAGAAGNVQAQDDASSSGYAMDAVYTADAWRNAHGGRRIGGAYLVNGDLTLSVDGERAWGLPGVSAYAHVLYNNGKYFSERYVGDAMTVSNIDAPDAVRLYEAWFEWALPLRQPLSLRAGLYDLNSEFDNSESRSLFIHSTHGVGHELAQTGLNGPSIFPVTSLGLRAAWQPAEHWLVQAVVLDGVPGDPDRTTGTHIRLGGGDGELVVGEVQWSGGRIRKAALGHWLYTAEFDDLRSTETEPRRRRDDNSGSYAALEIALGNVSGTDDPATLAFARYGVANDDINEYRDSFSFGVTHRGLIGARPDDHIGLAFSRADLGSVARQIASLAGEARPGYESVIELTYRAEINDWLTIQPDVQYIINPGADTLLADSLAFGLRFELSRALLR